MENKTIQDVLRCKGTGCSSKCPFYRQNAIIDSDLKWSKYNHCNRKEIENIAAKVIDGQAADMILSMKIISRQRNQLEHINFRVPQWVCVEDALPEEDGIFITLSRITNDTFYTSTSCFDGKKMEFDFKDVLWWMRVPDPPDEAYKDEVE